MNTMKQCPKAHAFSKGELVQIFDQCLGKTLGQVDSKGVFKITEDKPKITGIAGMVIEQSVLGYDADSRQEADLEVDGKAVELKTTGMRLTKTVPPVYEAKEPMSITAVSPKNIVTETFATSHFWGKLERMLLVYYLYAAEGTVPAAAYANFPIKGYEFHEFTALDKKILEQDWTIVRDFIHRLQQEYGGECESQYPRLSHELRKELLFIDTAPKWPNPPRFRLKRSVVSTIVQKHFGKRLEQLPQKYSSFAQIDDKLRKLTKRYGGKTIGRLAASFHIKPSKSAAEQFVVHMFGGKSKKMSGIELFQEIGLCCKSITLTKRGTRTEDMKLFTLDFEAIRTETFEESAIREYFASQQMLCVVFEEPSTEAPLVKNKFVGFKRLVFDDDFIEREVRPVWERIRDLIVNDKLRDEEVCSKLGLPIYNPKSGTKRTVPNFPKSSEGIIFVRGTGTDASDKPLCVNGIHMLRQNLWIKGSYIAKRLEDTPFI